MRIKKSFLSRILFASAMAAILCAFSAQTASAAFPDDWLYQKGFEIDHTKIDSALTNFPVAVVLNNSNFGFSQARSDGFDVRFTADDGITLLDFERELHDATAKQAVYWVRLPSVSATENTKFYIHYGNSTATDASDTSGAVWDSHYLAVWHLSENGNGTADEYKDTTGSNRDGTGFDAGSGSAPTRTNGQLGYGQQFSGGNREGIRAVNIPQPTPVAGTTFTLSLWAYRDWTSPPSPNPGIAQTQNGGDIPNSIPADKSIGAWATGISAQTWGRVVQTDTTTQNLTPSPTTVLVNQTWYHLSYVANGSVFRLFINGTEVSSITYDGTLQALDRIFLGKQGATESWKGILDEARFSDTNRSDAWVKASYHSGNNSLLLPSATVEKRLALSFDGTTDFIEVEDDSSLDLTTAGSLEAWIYMFGTVDNAGIIHKGDGSTDEAYSLRFGAGTQNDQIQLAINNGTDILTSDTDLTIGQWYHVAGIWNGTDMKIYINGILDKSQTNTVAAQDSAEKLIIGAQNDAGSNSFYGIIDEARVWSVALDSSDIDDLRDWICKKIDNTHPYYASLGANWRFDEDSDPLAVDSSGNDNTGIINNAIRICSEAPIGDESAHDYVGSASSGEFTASILSNDQQLTATEDGGTWGADSGIQVYRVNARDDQPGPLGTRLFRDRGYWGVFVTGGNGPTYKIEYNYDASNNDGIPGVGNEADLRLNWRHSNCEIWKSLDATPGTNTLTKGGFSGTEFILGTDLPPRNAILFDGTDDYVDCGNKAVLDIINDITIEAWVYPDVWTPGTNPGIVAKRSAYATMDWELYYNVGANRVEFWYGNSGANKLFAPPNAPFAPVSLATGMWQHIAITNSGDIWTLYINGVLRATETNAAPLPTGDNLIIGLLSLDAPNVTNCFNGKIDEVRVWNVARSQTAIRDTMCKKVTSADSDYANLVGNWRFDEETDSCICQDETINDNDGIMVNFGACDTDDIRAPGSAPPPPSGMTASMAIMTLRLGRP